jgi:hypothetical protein
MQGSEPLMWPGAGRAARSAPPQSRPAAARAGAPGPARGAARRLRRPPCAWQPPPVSQVHVCEQLPGGQDRGCAQPVQALAAPAPRGMAAPACRLRKTISDRQRDAARSTHRRLHARRASDGRSRRAGRGAGRTRSCASCRWRCATVRRSIASSAAWARRPAGPGAPPLARSPRGPPCAAAPAGRPDPPAGPARRGAGSRAWPLASRPRGSACAAAEAGRPGPPVALSHRAAGPRAKPSAAPPRRPAGCASSGGPPGPPASPARRLARPGTAPPALPRPPPGRAAAPTATPAAAPRRLAGRKAAPSDCSSHSCPACAAAPPARRSAPPAARLRSRPGSAACSSALVAGGAPLARLQGCAGPCAGPAPPLPWRSDPTPGLAWVARGAAACAAPAAPSCRVQTSLRLLPGRGCGAGAAVANVCPPALSRCQTCTPMLAPPLQHSPDGPSRTWCSEASRRATFSLRP